MLRQIVQRHRQIEPDLYKHPLLLDVPNMVFHILFGRGQVRQRTTTNATPREYRQVALSATHIILRHKTSSGTAISAISTTTATTTTTTEYYILVLLLHYYYYYYLQSSAWNP